MVWNGIKDEDKSGAETPIVGAAIVVDMVNWMGKERDLLPWKEDVVCFCWLGGGQPLVIMDVFFRAKCDLDCVEWGVGLGWLL